MARRTTVTATVYDSEGFPFICFRGNAQDIADCAAIYVMNVASPLGLVPNYEVELIERRTEDDPQPKDEGA